MHDVFKVGLIAAHSLLAVAPTHAITPEDDVIVTATGSPTPQQRLPADTAVIDVDAARERGRVTLDAALADAPGIQAPRTGPIGQQASVFSGGFESNQTLVLFDGVRLDDPSTPEGIFDAGQDLLGDAARIEVVQGPMSALYGSGALGGVVNVLPRRGGDGGFNPRLEAAAGSFATIMGTASADGGLGLFRYAVTADGYASEGYDIVPERIATHTGERDGAAMTTLTGVFDFKLNEEIEFDLLARRREASAEYDPGFFGNIAENPDAEIIQNDVALWRAGAAWSPAPPLRFRISGGTLETDRVAADAGVVGDEYHGAREFSDVSATWRTNAWTLQFGAQAEDERIEAVSFGSSIYGEQSHWGGYATAQGAVVGVDVTAAIRHDDFEGFGGQTTWRAGASVRAGRQGRLYAAYGTAYRAPSLYERFVPFFGATGLQPESAISWEIGGDGALALFDRPDGMKFSALYRRSEIEDLIGFSGFVYANVDRAEIDFAEARLTLRPTHWFSARVSYANTDARDTVADESLLRRPRHAWNGQFDAEYGAFSANLSWRQVGARMDTVYDDFGVFAGTGRVAAYDVVSASVSWAPSEHATLFIAADNVLDETYEPVNGFAGAPRSIVVGVRYDPRANRGRAPSD